MDAILAALRAKQDVTAQTERLKQCGPGAVPRLLAHLATADRSGRTLAFYGLQHCWAPVARAAVAPFLADPDPELRRMAAIVLARGAGMEALLDACAPLIDHPDPEIAGFALDQVEPERPDLARVEAFSRRPALAAILVRHGARYHSRSLVPMADAVLADPARRAEWPYALAALIHNHGDRPDQQAQALALAADPDPVVRDAAADYLLWHGTPDLAPRCVALAACESDPVTAAGLLAAAAALARRPAVPRPPWDGDQPPLPAAARAAAFRSAAESLATPIGEDAWAQAWRVYRTAETFEPAFAYRGRDPDSALAAERAARRLLQERLFGFPAARPADPAAASADPAPVERYAPPVRDYFDPARASYGLVVPHSAIKGFTGLVHVGDDVAWHRPHAPVLAVADGVVRLAGFHSTWGHLVVVEHRTGDGARFCSLYAHLSPFLCVAAGERVAAGAKLGAVGRSFTIENGGYAAHLHVAIRRGPFIDPPKPGAVIDLRHEGKPYRGVVEWADRERTLVRVLTLYGFRTLAKSSSWLTGYISEAWRDAGDHGWEDPQQFLEPRVRAQAGG